MNCLAGQRACSHSDDELQYIMNWDAKDVNQKVVAEATVKAMKVAVSRYVFFIYRPLGITFL